VIEVAHPEELRPFVGKELGVSGWRSLTLEDLRGFGAITGDEHWIHTDPERAARETPYGGVLAHGFLLLSLVIGMAEEIYTVHGAKSWLNYGVDKVRFTHPVTLADRLRLRVTLLELEEHRGGGTRLKLGLVLEIDGNPRPALVADWICIAYAGDAA
jgi:acyl dehydratase